MPDRECIRAQSGELGNSPPSLYKEPVDVAKNSPPASQGVNRKRQVEPLSAKKGKRSINKDAQPSE